MHLQAQDVVRHKIVADIVTAYDRAAGPVGPPEGAAGGAGGNGTRANGSLDGNGNGNGGPS